MPVKVTTYKEPPPALFALLKSHVPHSLPLLRRLEFARFPGGITEHTHVLWASDAELADELPASSAGFTAGYLDFSRGPETQLWLYSSLERDHANGLLAADVAAGPCGEQAVAALREARRIRDRERDNNPSASASASPRGEEEEEGEQQQRQHQLQSSTLLLGGTSDQLRQVLANRGVVFPYVSLWDKWLFRLEALPDIDVAGGVGDAVPGAGTGLPPGLQWGVVRREEIPFVLSKTEIQRRERTIKLLRSIAIKLEDGTPIAWAFLGPDSSLSSLHCEPQYRGKGLAKAVAVKLFRECLPDYGNEGYGWADVAPDNVGSQGVCKSLGGKIVWSVCWCRPDLDRSFPDL